MRESKIEGYLTRRATECGALVRKLKWIGRNGAPDRVVMHKGRAFWVELKAPGKEPEPHQLREHARMRAVGQHVIVIDSLSAVDYFVGMYL